MRLSGFGTLGVIHSNAPVGWGFRREISQPANGAASSADVDSRLGAQLNYTINAQVELVGQVIATRRSAYAGNSDGLEWAFAAWRPNADLALRVGRVNVDAFLMSDHRNVGFAYLYARPPVEFYASIPSSLDGADISRVWNQDGTQWHAKAFAGRAHGGDLSQDARTEINSVLGAMVAREEDGLLVRASVTRAKLATSPPALRPLLDALGAFSALPVSDVAVQAAALRVRLDGSGSRLVYSTLGVSYERSDWVGAAELTRAFGHPTVRFSAGYASLGRRIGIVTLYGIVSRTFTTERPVTPPDWGAALTAALGPSFAQQAQVVAVSAAFAVNKTRAEQNTISLGTRWDLLPRLALKLQWDRVRIGANGGRLWANSGLDSGHANVASALLDFVF